MYSRTMMSPGDSHRVAATSTRTHKHTRTHVTSFTFQRTNTRPDSWTALQSPCGQSMTCCRPVVVDDRVTMSSSRATRGRLGSRMEEARSLTVLIPSRQLGGAVLPRGLHRGRRGVAAPTVASVTRRMEARSISHQQERERSSRARSRHGVP